MTGRHLGRWAPLPIPELARILSPARFAWWIAGGHALDLFLNRTTRHHHDLDVAQQAGAAASDPARWLSAGSSLRRLAVVVVLAYG